MCVNEAGSIRLMEEKDVEQVEELEKQARNAEVSFLKK